MNCLTLRGITREYAGRTVLDIPRLEIGEGEICALLGPNGAGKTTLLSILAHLERPSAGEVSYRNGNPGLSGKERQRLRREIVMVDQSPVMFSSSVLANMEFGLRVRKIEAGERGRRVAEALELVGMDGFASAPAHRLSGGETQRVAMARALALAPRVLLCDEPTSNVDIENQAIILEILRQINRERGTTIVFTTHDRAQAEHLARRLITLDRGRIIEGGYENIFSAELTNHNGSTGMCLLSPGISLRTCLPGGAAREKRVRVSIAAGQILLEAGSPQGADGNRLAGRVRQVTQVNGDIKIVVDGGPWFTVLVDDDAYRERPFSVGEAVTLRIPPEAIRLLP
jgi:tungstate transport system ATP-binding protein